jgi:hypothetical protein
MRDSKTWGTFSLLFDPNPILHLASTPRFHSSGLELLMCTSHLNNRAYTSQHQQFSICKQSAPTDMFGTISTQTRISPIQTLHELPNAAITRSPSGPHSDTGGALSAPSHAAISSDTPPRLPSSHQPPLHRSHKTVQASTLNPRFQTFRKSPGPPCPVGARTAPHPPTCVLFSGFRREPCRLHRNAFARQPRYGCALRSVNSC